MSLPDRMERIGVFVGSFLMTSLPLSAASIAVFGYEPSVWAGAAWLVIALAFAFLVATGRIPVSYQRVWFVCVVGYIAALLAWEALGLSPAAEHTALALTVLVAALAVAFGIDTVRRPDPA